MIARGSAVLALAFVFSGAAMAAEEPGIAIGAAAPPLEGKAWVTADGKAPDLHGKVQLVHFWFAG